MRPDWKTSLKILRLMGRQMPFAVLLSGALIACKPAQEPQSSQPLGAATQLPMDQPVADVNGTPILISDVEWAWAARPTTQSAAALHPGSLPYTTLVERLIDRRLLALEAISEGVDRAPQTQAKLTAASEHVLGNAYIERHFETAVSEADISQLYAAQLKLMTRGDEVQSRHILVETQEAAQDLLEKIEAGEDFSVLAEAQSLDKESAAKGGDIGYITQDMLPSDFTTPIFKAELKTLIGPFQTEAGWHIAEVQDRRQPTLPSLEEMRPRLVDFMRLQAIEELLNSLRAAANLQIKSPETPPEILPETQPDRSSEEPPNLRIDLDKASK